MTAYVVCVWLHILAAATWIGSMVFFAAVIVPVLRRGEIRANAPQLLRLIGARFRVLGWIALGGAIVTGIGNIFLRGLSWSVVTDRSFWAGGFGQMLGWKIALVAVVVATTLIHEVAVGRRALDELERGSDKARTARIRRRASLIGRFTMIASIVIVFFAVAMVRGCTLP